MFVGPDSHEPSPRAKSVDSLWVRAPNEDVWVTTPAPAAPAAPVAPPAPAAPAAPAAPVPPPRVPVHRPVPAWVAAAPTTAVRPAPTATLTATPITAAPTATAPITAAPGITTAPITAAPITAAPITAAPSLEVNGSGRNGAGVADLLAPSTPAPPLGGKAKTTSRGRRWIIEWALVILVAVGVAVGIRTFVVQTFFIPSGSMEPTLMVGDRILVDKLSYHLHAVHRGDIVVFAKPPGENDPNVSDLVKRVIGLPGDTISSADGRVDIDGKPLSEPWLPRGTVTTGIQTMTIPPNEYFVMGDNRSDSQDSRFFGPISRSLIVGRVVLRIWPVSHFHVF